ncbi:MAG: iron ABC transporter permease [Armatimonadetes bacterium]|nr:iron ABC transporter permease [Armatimonadota bacterium]
MRVTWARLVGLVILFSLLLVLVALVALAAGSTRVSLHEALSVWGTPRAADSTAYQIIFRQRLPRVILGALVGFGLGLAGTAFQAILRNPLADPYTLGVASGSAVGAVVAISFPVSLALGPFTTVQAAALLGAGLIMLLIYRLGTSGREFRVEGLLLGGVTVALVASSGILLIRTVADPTHLVAIDRWLMGGLVVIGSRDIAAILPLLLPGVVVLLQLGGAFNQLALGEELAHGRGVDPASVQRWAFFAASLVTAAVVSVAGPIGFVGMIVPHAVRRVVGVDHRVVLPCAALAAAAFLVACDAVARTVVAPTELPVGVVTAILGGPVFVGILMRSARRMG